ncbi:Uncharacterized protein Adt_22518 [Abeliophyllum distichum]|uniref:Uncharacterized protein n=1 Tax=Abeliophyllum distichum TaxID=126358 RepID=A0ABD1T2K5_9LAMI
MLNIEQPKGRIDPLELTEKVVIDEATNNDTEYEAVITGQGLAIQLGVTVVEICSNLQLVVGKILREYEAKDGHMGCLSDESKRHATKIQKVQDYKGPKKGE